LPKFHDIADNFFHTGAEHGSAMPALVANTTRSRVNIMFARHPMGRAATNLDRLMPAVLVDRPTVSDGRVIAAHHDPGPIPRILVFIFHFKYCSIPQYFVTDSNDDMQQDRL